MKKRQVDYIRLFRIHSLNKKVELKFEDCLGIQVLDIIFYNAFDKEDDEWEIQIKKCRKQLSKYDIHGAAYYVEESLKSLWSKGTQSFLARKRELLNERLVIIKTLSDVNLKKEERKRILLCLDSDKYSFKELEWILLEVKDLFEDIYLFVKTPISGVERLCNNLYEQWGLAVNRCEEADVNTLFFHGVFFFVKCWEPWCETIVYENAYMISEKEDDREIAGKGKGKHLYSGMEYQVDGKEIPYQMAVDLLYQDRENNRKIESTIIDIYEVK